MTATEKITVKLPEEYIVQERINDVLIRCSISDSDYLNLIVRLLKKSRARGNLCYWKKRIEVLKFTNELTQKHLDKYEKLLEEHRRWDADEAKPLEPIK